MSFRASVEQMLKARFPILYVETFEEHRALAEIASVASSLRVPRPVMTWSATQGLNLGDGGRRETQEPSAALDAVLRRDEAAVYVFQDLHTVLGDGQRPPDAGVVRRLRDIANGFKAGGQPRTLIILSPLRRIPAELEKDITLVDFPLPGESDIRALLDGMIARNSSGGRIQVRLEERGRERLAKAATGLTLGEAENAFARAMVIDGVLDDDDVEVVLDEKRQTIRKSGLLEFIAVDVELDDVGGLLNLKRWLAKRADSWLEEAHAYGLPAPKGVLITGVPGCGKSLTAKAIAAAWGLPLLRMDIGRVFAGLVGSSEQNMRTGISTAEAIAPCVLWIDEIEKGFAGATGGGGDSGTASRVFGSFLTWMQEKSAPVFVIATANNIERLPPEFLRKGRFDEIFFVDLPSTAERRAIWSLQLDKRAHGVLATAAAGAAKVVDELAELSDGYSGAEIEQAVVAGLFDAFAERRQLTREDLIRAVTNMVPLSVTQAEQIAELREWANVRAVAATTSEDRDPAESTMSAGRHSPPEVSGASRNDDAVRAAGSWADPDRSRGGRAVDF